MTHSQRSLPALLCLCMLSACGSSEPEARPQPPPMEETVFGDMAGTLDRAQGVQDTMDARKQQLDSQLATEEAANP